MKLVEREDDVNEAGIRGGVVAARPMSSGLGQLLRLAIPPPGVVLAMGLARLSGFNQGIDVGRHVFGPWDVRDPIADLKHDHAGAVAFRSVFA